MTTLPFDNPEGVLLARLKDYDDRDLRKQTIYMPVEMLREVLLEADRQDRPISWVMRKAWQIARKEIISAPSTHRALQESVIRSRASAHGGALEQ